jgi:hypothetical protein
LAATLGTGVLTYWIIGAFDSLGVPDFKNTDAAVPLEDSDEVEGKSLYASHMIVNADTGTSAAAVTVTQEWDKSEAAASALPFRSQMLRPKRRGREKIAALVPLFLIAREPRHARGSQQRRAGRIGRTTEFADTRGRA